jgi:AAA domain
MKTLTLDEYADLADQEPDEYLIEQFIPYPGRVLLIGPPKEGKSFFGLQLALAVAKGEPFMGRHTKSSKVLYLQYDTPHKIWMKRAAKLRRNGMTFHPNFHMLDPKDPSYKRTIDVRKRVEDVIYLKEVVEKIQPKLVIIDTLRKMFSGDENSSDIGAEVFNILNEIFINQAVVYIHHTHKLSPPPGQKIQARIRPVDALRGSSFYSGEVEAVYLILGNQLISDSRIDEATTTHLQWDKVSQQWSFPDVEKLNKKEQQIRQLYASKSWPTWNDFYRHISHTIVDVPDHLMTRLEGELPLMPGSSRINGT